MRIKELNYRLETNPFLSCSHNFHHYNRFFAAIRQHIQSDTLPELRRLIAEQCKSEDFQDVFKTSEGSANKSLGMVILKK